MYILRPDQKGLKDDIRDSFRAGNKMVLAVAPTGFGKTVVFSDICRDVSNNDKNVMVMAHRGELLFQCGEKLESNDVQFSYIKAGLRQNLLMNVQVGSVQTIVKRMKKLNLPVPDLIIIDEAHRSLAKTYRDIIDFFREKNPSLRGIGFTATPERGDGKPLSEVYDDMVLGPTIIELISDGRLVKPITYAPLERLDLSSVRSKGNDYNEKDLEIVVDKPRVTGSAVEHYRKICDRAPAVAFCVSIQHAKHVAEEFREAGYTCEHIDGTMSDDERRAILGRLESRETNIVTSVDLITEGFDCPMVQCAIMLRPTKSVSLYIQMAGRALRTHPGKDCAYILDHAGCVFAHGLITEEREWSLDGRQKRKIEKKGLDPEKSEAIKTKQCPMCYAVHELSKQCPMCKFEYPVEYREVEQEEGQLTIVDKETEEAINRARRKEVAMAKTLDELKEIGKKRGYKNTWAHAVWGGRNKKKMNL